VRDFAKGSIFMVFLVDLSMHFTPNVYSSRKETGTEAVYAAEN
jgi:hypothetical protein